jgi:catechol 2,3-dioxygenase-like lactoylglutathione lyase family enzyme
MPQDSAPTPTPPHTHLLADPPQRLHHHAFAVRDQEANRAFIEDVLGIPLTATWCERALNPTLGREVDYCHTFYEMADGSALAFFQFADPDAAEMNRAHFGPAGGAWHVAFKVSDAGFAELESRLTAAAIPYRRTDHGYCVSMYVKTPDGLPLEFTVDAPHAAELAALRRTDAHSELQRWLAGDRRVNNDHRPH